MRYKNNFSFIFFFIFPFLYLCQGKTSEEFYSRYILIEDLSQRNEMKSYRLNAKELYGIDKNIEIFNFFTKGGSIILVSALPNLWEDSNWVKINYELVKGKIMTNQEITSLFSNMLNNNSPSAKTMDYGIIKKINNEYFVPYRCLIETFSIGEYESPLIVPYGTINIKGQKVSIKDMQRFYNEKLPKIPFPLDIRISHQELLFNHKLLAHNYLSGTILLKNNIAYKFWTFDSWRVHDGYNEQRGIDRFVYIPEKGIIGGSYDFYFIRNPKNTSYNILWDNIINEKVMIAEELK